MPWRSAMPNNSTIARSTTSLLGSAGCRILFIASPTNLSITLETMIRIQEILPERSNPVCSKLHTFVNCGFVQVLDILLRFQRIDNLGAYSIPSATGPLNWTWRSHAQKCMSTPFEGLSIRQVRATMSRTLCLLHTEAGFMSARSPVSVDIKHKKFTGEYEMDCGVLNVFFEGRSKSSAITGLGPELLARLLLIELVCHAPSWRDHPRAILRAGS